VAAHGSVWNLSDVYRAAGVAFPGARRLGRNGGRSAAIVVPPRFLATPQVLNAAPLRVAAVTGWGERAQGPKVDEVIPLSDHSDFDGLLALVAAVRPKKVHVVHGYATEFAAELRARGYDAEGVEGHSGPPDEGRVGAFGA